MSIYTYMLRAWLAMEVPETPIAMPTSAAASAGPSFTPSPSIPTTSVPRIAATAASLLAGFMPQRDSAMPTATPTACAG